MKHAFRNTVSHDKLRGLSTRKKVTSLLILTAFVAVFFATPTVSCARSNLDNGGSQSPIATPTSHTQLSSEPTVPLIAIRMLDTTHGWALTDTSVLKTADGGVHWQNVTPQGQTLGQNVQGEFLTTQTAWAAWQSTYGYPGQTQTITILHTSNGGTSWQTTTINNAIGSLVDPPRFINTQQGWLVTSQPDGMTRNLITTYRTTNAGQTWTNISGQGQVMPLIFGLSFSNAQLGWLGLSWQANQPVIEKIVNGGSWQQQALSAPANIAKIDNAETMASVLIGADGVLPTRIWTTGTGRPIRLAIYTTHDTGLTWTAGTVATFDSTNVYALDAQHVWAEETNSDALHFSSDGGKTWVQLGQTPQHLSTLSFIDTHNGWAIDNDGLLYQTTDGGTNWQQITYSIQTAMPTNHTQRAPLAVIHMLDKTHGWALTNTSILKTSDGGVHWQDVTPANVSIPQIFGGDFMNAQYAWVTTLDQKNFLVGILHTTNGGKSWLSSTVVSGLSDIGSLDMPHFVNTSDGWLEIFGTPGMGSRGSYLFYTIDSGQHWTQLVDPNRSGSVHRSLGISFSDVRNGWQTGDGGGGDPNPAQPLLDVTHDGGQTWQSVQLPALPGAGQDNMVETTPPVIFGNNGLLPVTDNGVTFSTTGVNPSSTGLDLYVTHNAGLTWSPTKFVIITGDEVPIVSVTDIQHAWATTSTGTYATSDGGQSWTKFPPTPQPIGMMSFIDAKNGWAVGPRDIPFHTNDSRQPFLLHTTDGGRTWQHINYSIQ